MLKSFFDQNFQFTYLYASIKNIQAQEKPSTLKRLYLLLDIFLGHFWPPGSKSNQDPDPQHYCYIISMKEISGDESILVVVNKPLENMPSVKRGEWEDLGTALYLC